MEERYQGLSLVFSQNESLRTKILETIDEVKSQTKQTPFIFEKTSKDRADLHAVYIEFRDDIHREGGEFLTKVLKKLNIDKCEKDI
jgi:ERCC4-type nuclease